MSKETKTIEWHSMEEVAAKALVAVAEVPHLVFPLQLSALPNGIQRMPGLVSAFASHYLTTQSAQGGVSALGEFAAIRTESTLGKAYNYIFGVSSDSKVYFTGPFKDFPNHHFQSSASVPIESLFNVHSKGKDCR